VLRKNINTLLGSKRVEYTTTKGIIMRINLLKSILRVALISTLLPLLGYAAGSEVNDAKLKVFNDACVSSWMKGVKSDSAETKAFAERFCTCAGNHMLPVMNKEKPSAEESDSAKKEATNSCLTEAVLQQAVNTFSDDQTVTEADLKKACDKSWGMVFTTGSNAKQQKYADSYCSCASAPLSALTDKEEKLSDAEYNKHVSSIASTCNKKVGEPSQI
jgi:hypothetical protein